MAEAKAGSLRAAGSRLEVVAPQVTTALAGMADRGELIWHRRTFDPADLDGAWFAVAATSAPEVNAQVVAAAEERRVFCVRADDATGGTASLIAAVHRGPLLLAVSTSGRAPALASALRTELAERYGEEWGVLADVMGELRADPQVREALGHHDAVERRARWRAVIDPVILDLIRSGRRDKAKEVAAACLCSSSD